MEGLTLCLLHIFRGVLGKLKVSQGQLVYGKVSG